MQSWAGGLAAITLFAEDLDEVRRFYADVVGLPVRFEDPNSVVYEMGGVLVNYLAASEADPLVSPAPVGDATAGVRMQITIPVEDVHAAADRFREAGGVLLRGPEIRPWGMTTATFRDPAGHVWEMAS